MPVQHTHLPAQNDIRFFRIRIQDDACDPKSLILPCIRSPARPAPVGRCMVRQSRQQHRNQLLFLLQFPGGRHNDYHQLTGRKARACHHVPDRPIAAGLAVGADAALLHPGDNRPDDSLILLDSDYASMIVDNCMRASRIESGCYSAVPVCSDRKLRLVPVVPWILHPYDGLKDCFLTAHGSVGIFSGIQLKPSDPDQVLTDFALLEAKLGRIAQLLDLAASAASCAGASGLHPVSTWGEEFLQPGISIVFLHLHDPGPYQVSCHSVLHKDGHASGMAYSESFRGHIFYQQLRDLILLHLCFPLNPPQLSLRYHGCFPCYHSPVLRRLDSIRRLNPSHSSDPRFLAAARISFMVSSFASALSARFRAIASARDGLFGLPYSYSP